VDKRAVHNNPDGSRFAPSALIPQRRLQALYRWGPWLRLR